MNGLEVENWVEVRMWKPQAQGTIAHTSAKTMETRFVPRLPTEPQQSRVAVLNCHGLKNAKDLQYGKRKAISISCPIFNLLLSVCISASVEDAPRMQMDVIGRVLVVSH